MANPQAEQNIFVFKGNHEKDEEYTELERVGKTHWQSDYACDIFKSMQEQEQRRRPLKYRSPQLKEREETMNLLKEVTRAFKFSRCALHLAMYYLDRFADHFIIRSDKFALVGLICLHIGAQIEDTDAFIPRYSEMNRLVQDAYTANEYKVVERKILRFFNFEMIHPTTASFVEMLSCTFLTHTDFHDYIRMLDGYERDHYVVPYQRFESFEQMLAKLAQQLLRLANFTLTFTTLANVAPSLVAAACIAAVRQVNGVKRWSQYLIDLTTYTEAQVEPYSEEITMYYYYQFTPPPSQVLLPELDKEQNICEHSMGPSNPNWSSPDSGFEEHSTVLVEITEALQLPEPAPTAASPYREPEANLKRRRQEDDTESDNQPYKQPKLLVIRLVQKFCLAKEPLTTDTDFKESLPATKEFIKSLRAGIDFKEPLAVNEEFKEPKQFLVHEISTSLKVETFSVIPVSTTL